MSEVSYTLVIAGDSGTGKTSLLLRMSKDRFEENLDPTVTGTVSPVTLDIKGQQVRLNIWDTSGTDEYQAMNTREMKLPPKLM